MNMQAVKKGAIDTPSDIVKFINRESIAKRLNTLVSFMLNGRKVDFRLNMKGGSFTDGKTVVVGVPDNIYKKTKEEAYIMLSALAVHEAQHVKSSNFKELEAYMKRMRNFFVGEGVASDITDKISHSIANILEDGRIENIAGKSMEGIKPNIQFLRMTDWQGSRVEGLDDMTNYINTMLFQSVLGIYPKGYHEHASDEVKNEIEKIENLIVDAVQARTAKECLMIAEEIITVHSKDFLLKHIKTANKNLQKFNQMKKLLEELLKDIHENSEESETQDSGGLSIHIESKGSKKGGGKGKGKQQKEKDKEGSSGKGKSEEEEVDKKEDSKDSSGSGDEDSKEEEKEDSKDGEGSSSAKDEKEGEGESEETNTDNSNGEASDDGENSDKKNDSSSNDDAEANEANMELSEGANPEYEDRGRTEDEYQALLNEIREGLMDEAKNEVQKAQREAKSASISVDYTLTDVEVKEAIGSNGYSELPNSFPLDQSLPQEVKVMANKFRRSIENIFKNRTRINLAGQDKGILNPEQLYKVAMRDYNVFKEEGRKTTSDYVAFILQDGSGSMMGEKEKYSAYALSVIEEGLRGVIPYKMSTFNTGGRGITHHVVKNWNDKSKKNYAINFLKYKKAGGGNYDSYSIAIASKELMKRPERDKILIVLSDGLPASIERTKAAIKKARDQKIHVVGIMFGDDDFRINNYDRYKDMYQKNIIATAPNKIPVKLAEVLKEILAR